MTDTTTQTPERTSPKPKSNFFDARTWADANGLGINTVYEYLRRERDPLPHIRQGRRKLIDDALAVRWMRRNFGVNTKERS